MKSKNLKDKGLQIKNYPFHQLPFSDLFKTYLSDFSRLQDFYETNPFSESEVEQAIAKHDYSGNRQKTTQLLREINKPYNLHPEAENNLNRLAQSDAVAIVTGQQLGVYGGPVYTIFKTLSTIHLAKKLEKKFGRPVVPVFWLADEDHDYDEIRSVTILNKDVPKTFSLPEKNGALPPVAELNYQEAVQELRQKIKQAQYDTDFSTNLWELLDRYFEKGQRFDKAFGGFISELFSKHGLVLAGSNHPKVKQVGKECMAEGIRKADQIRESLETQTQAIRKSFKQQVKLYDANLFYLDESAGRQKISRNGEGWTTNGNKKWNTDQLVREIEEHPENFSPNVFMRPILQDVLLPTLGYVAGPGELAYYGQMKSMYRQFDLKMPIIFPRMSGTLVEPPIARILKQVPFEIHEFNQRIEDLESQFVDRTEKRDIESIFSEWLDGVQQSSEDPIQNIAQIDPTLEASAEKVLAVFNNELNKLKGKVYRSVKSQQKIQLKRIRRIQQHLFPERNLQERTLSGIYFMNLYGVDIWDKLLRELPEDEVFDTHKLIYL